MINFVSIVSSLFILPEHNYINIILRLIFSVIVGGIIGLERSGRNHDAGLRTHILVCLGAATIMVFSEMTHILYGGDVGRFGAQVVSGIGFLGAGCIIVKGDRVSGLTTAAGLWTTACIGLTVGMGYFFVSSVTAILLFVSMRILQPISSLVRDKSALCHHTISIKLRNRGGFSIISDYILNHELNIESVEMTTYNVFILKISAPCECPLSQLVCMLMENEEVLEVNLI